MLHFRRIAMGASKPSAPGFNIDNYLTIEALEDGMTVSLSRNSCEYCIDGSGNWVALPAATATPAVNTGQTLSFKATGLTPTAFGIGTFSISKKCNLKGNCMSMVYGDEAEGKITISEPSQFRTLFANCTEVISVSSKFLPATTLAILCYMSMFEGCTSLTTAPELPATDLPNYCYRYMYDGCVNLNYIKAMLVTKDVDSTQNWVRGVSATGTFVKNAAATWNETGVNGIPSGWTIEEVEV